MTKTKYYDLQMDDPQDDYDVEVVNANLKKIDEQMKTRENATDALQEPEFTVADKRENIASKEKMPKILGKIAKFFTDLKTVAFTGSYKDLTDRPLSLPANGGNASTVNRHTVDSDVPANAKFTDTNTWRGVQDNLTSSATDQSLSANQGKKLKGLLDGKAALNHNHAYPGGFAGTDAMNWGVQTGSAVCGWSDGAGGSIGFRKNCPENGKVSMVIDGTVYTNEGKDQVLTTGNWSNYAAAKNHSHTVDSAMSSTSANPVQNKVVNNALEKKLDAAKVANNLTTNVAGYALDARQGKKLQDQLTALNGSLGTFDFIPDGSNLNYYTSGVHMIENTDKLENSPDTSWGILIAFGSDSIYSVQIVISVIDSKNNIYVRTKKETNEWCPWFKK